MVTDSYRQRPVCPTQLSSGPVRTSFIEEPRTRSSLFRSVDAINTFRVSQLIAETFRPYLEARDWVSINRGKIISFDDRETGS